MKVEDIDWDNIELEGSLNKAEFYPAEDGWAELIGVYEIGGKNWLFFRTKLEMEYEPPSVKYKKFSDNVMFSPRRINIEARDAFVMPDGEYKTWYLPEWEEAYDVKSPVSADFPVWVSEYPFLKTIPIKLI